MSSAFKKLLIIIVSAAVAAALMEAVLVLKRGSAHKGFKKDAEVDWNYYHQIYEPCATPFFKKKTVDGKKQYYFARKWTADRPPFKAVKAKDEIRIFVIGESVAEGIGRSLASDLGKEMFASRFPGREITIVNAGVGAYTSAQVLSVAKEVVRHKPDIILVLMGNNIYGGIHYKTWRLLRSPFPMRQLYLNSWIFRTIIDWFYFRGEIDNYYDIEKFQQDYEDLANLLSHKKIPFVVFTLPANYADFPPWQGMRKEHIIPMLLVEEGRFQEALELINPGSDALLWFLKGHALRGLGLYAEARQAYLKVLDINLSDRASPIVNTIIRDIAKKYPATLIEIDKLFESASETGLTGDNLFKDQCHWYGAYDTIIIDELLRRINQFKIAGVSPVPEDALFPLITAQELAVRVNQEKKQNANADELGFINEAVKDAGDLCLKPVYYFRRMIRYKYEEAKDILNKKPQDYRVLLEAKPWTRHAADKLEDNWHRVLAYAGEAFREKGDMDTAVRFFDAAINRNPNAPEAYFFRALLEVRERRSEEAIRDFAKAAELGGYDIPDEEIIKTVF